MVNLKLISSIIIDEVFDTHTDTADSLIQIIGRIVREGNYKAIETGIVFNRKANEFIRNSCENHKIRLTQWMTRAFDANNLNLSSLNREHREKSIQKAIEYSALAAEAGAKCVAVISGKCPGKSKRDEAKKCLYDSMTRICERLQQYSMRLLIEPLDYSVHKKQLIGTTADAVEIVKKVQDAGLDAWIAWDSAHTALNNEDLIESLVASEEYIAQIHLSNAILDPANPRYGDYHMYMGLPGFMTLEFARNIINKVKKFHVCRSDISVAVEMRSMPEDDIWENERASREFLFEAMNEK